MHHTITPPCFCATQRPFPTTLIPRCLQTFRARALKRPRTYLVIFEMSGPLKYQQCARLMHSEGHSDAVSVVTFSPDGSYLGSGGLDGRICIWSMPHGKLLYVFSGKSEVLSLVWLGQSNDRLICGMRDGTIACLSISSVSDIVHHHHATTSFTNRIS